MGAALARDADPSHSSRRDRRASEPDAVRAYGLDVRLSPLLFGAGLVLRPRAGHRGRARAGQAHGESSAASHGLAARSGFSRYHKVLNRARWNGHAVARTLLMQVLGAVLPAGEVVLGVDDTIERRWGPKIKARGLYRDPVRSSRGHFVRASGLRWLSLMVMVPISWAGRRWALRFLTVLAPSKHWSTEQGRRRKTVVDWAKLVKVPLA